MMEYVIKERGSDDIIAYGIEDESMLILEDSWYFALDQVNMSVLRRTDRTYTCPYKGVCYWLDLETPHASAQNIAWVYQTPKRGYEGIKDMIGFYSHDTAGTIAAKSPMHQNA